MNPALKGIALWLPPTAAMFLALYLYGTFQFQNELIISVFSLSIAAIALATFGNPPAHAAVETEEAPNPIMTIQQNDVAPAVNREFEAHRDAILSRLRREIMVPVTGTFEAFVPQGKVQGIKITGINMKPKEVEEAAEKAEEPEEDSGIKQFVGLQDDPDDDPMKIEL